jgi:hypothetical protein
MRAMSKRQIFLQVCKAALQGRHVAHHSVQQTIQRAVSIHR